MSRYAGMDNQAIADELRISKRTVENHLTLALKKLREASRFLASFLYALISFAG